MQCAQNRHEYFAQRLHHAMNGIGTKEYDDLIFIDFVFSTEFNEHKFFFAFSRNLIRIIVSRCDVDLHNIKQEYEKKFNRSVQADVSVL